MFISDVSSPSPETTSEAKNTVEAAKVPESQQAYSQESTFDRIDHRNLIQALENVEQSIAPVWPLEDYVAVNPFLGMADHSFLDARKRLRAVSEAEMLLPLDYYRQKLETGELTSGDIAAALEEMNVDTFAPRRTVEAVLETLQNCDGNSPAANAAERSVRTVVETIDLHTGSNWTETVQNEIGRHCAAHYDQGQAAWPSPWKDQPLYEAWRSTAKIDRRLDALGVSFFCRFASSLPFKADIAILHLLKKLQVPEDQWEDVLFCVAHTIPGWASWTRYQGEQAHRAGETSEDFAGLLAIRLAYDVALAEHTGFNIDWRSVSKLRSVIARTVLDTAAKHADLRLVLLRASELAWQRPIVDSLNLSTEDGSDNTARTAQKAAQMVFCIDVRSERYRRHLETSTGDVETFGFAGFFGVPIAVRGFDETKASSHVPALLSPSYVVNEQLRGVGGDVVEEAVGRRRFKRFLRKSWKQFSASAVSCFGFVETAGLIYAWKLLSKSLFGEQYCHRFDGVDKHDRGRLGPDLPTPQEIGITAGQQIDMAESILRGIGITSNFASVVVFCGHRSTSQNNPLQAGLDCGACCGHSGEPNARFAAKLFNQPFVREGLRERGIEVPYDTSFVAAVHDTTTDTVSFFDTSELPLNTSHALDHLRKATETATETCRLERMPSLGTESSKSFIKRASDWSEVRPEWGLAGNAAFIVGPRSLTANSNLEGRSFLHSYDYRNDPEFSVLEQIMTAPMVVAQWINMQYYASAVDNDHFGSGTKTVHNVVGHFGVHSGNGGDLTTGLAWESLHDGERYVHEPLRLTSVIAAPRKAIAEIISRHDNVRHLVTNGWMHLLAIDEGQVWRFTPQQTWVSTGEGSSRTDQHETPMARMR